MSRVEKFRSYKTHGWLSKGFKKLSQAELCIAEDFLHKYATLSQDEFVLAVNRMFIDKPKTKNYAVIMELLTCANSS